MLEVVWPEGYTKPSIDAPPEDAGFLVDHGESDIFPNGLIHPPSSEMRDSLLPVIEEVLKRVPDEDHAEVIEWIVQVLQFQNIDTMDSFLKTTMAFIRSKNVSSQSVQPLFEYIQRESSTYEYNFEDTGYHPDYRSYLEELLYSHEFTQSILEKVIFCLAQQPLADVKKTLSVLVNNKSYSQILNAVRAQIDSHTMRPAERSNLERLGKYMLGIDPESPIPFHTSLNSVYQKINFENYKPNLEKTRDELSLLIEQIGDSYEDKRKKNC